MIVVSTDLREAVYDSFISATTVEAIDGVASEDGAAFCGTKSPGASTGLVTCSDS